MTTRGLPLAVRLERMSIPEPNTGCWLWTATVCSSGYGSIKVTGATGRRMVGAHRVSWETFKGPIPKGLVIDHLCRMRSCINPDHLRVVTTWENIRTGISPVAQHAKATHCKRGHAFDAANTYLWPHTKGVARICRACRRTVLQRKGQS